MAVTVNHHPKRYMLWSSVLILLCFFSVVRITSAHHSVSNSEKKLYIVYMGSNTAVPAAEITTTTHHELLVSVLGSAGAAKSSLVHSYKHGFCGFSALLSHSEAAEISGMPGVVSAFPSASYPLQTTRSWDFMGVNLRSGPWKSQSFGKDIIVASIDTGADVGVWPEHESFNDENMDPIPQRWKGECEVGQNFTKLNCNKKLIGARYFAKGYEAMFGAINTSDPTVSLSPRDTEGHGTHTATTLGGSLTRNASFQGLAMGTARGGAPNSRVAAYKVCWPSSCQTADILAAFDKAINDGVDIISISLGGYAVDYFYDVIAIGSFHAMEKRILVVAAGGNEGPSKATVINSAPWILTAAASSMDREFVSNIRLGNNLTYSGPSLNNQKLVPQDFPLVYAGNIPADNVTSDDARLCGSETLDGKKVRGNIVVCVLGNMFAVNFPEEEVHAKGGVATIIIAEELKSFPQVFRQPAVTVISQGVGNHILAYINSTRNPMAMMTPTRTYLGVPGPLAATFSSRGPNSITPDMFKPDLTAPGVAILAGWSPAASPSEDPSDKRAFKYNIISGTSMSTPHVAGAAALVKAANPHWTPAAIKSALMTTARPLSTEYKQNVDANLAWGSGHINPRAALDPGLIYDTSFAEYTEFLCSMNYNNTEIGIITGNQTSDKWCYKQAGSVNNLNYPSIAVSNFTKPIRVVRSVTNVGEPMSVYKVAIHNPPGVKVSVTPASLKFRHSRTTISYTVTLSPLKFQPWRTNWVFGALIWVDGNHTVRTPIAAGPKLSHPGYPTVNSH